MNAKTIIITGGGTGGHVTPGLAIAKILKYRGWKVVWLGNPNKIEGVLVPKNGFLLMPLNFHGLSKSIFKNVFNFPFFFFQAFFQSFKTLLKIKPNIVLAMGGYIAFPGGIAAIFLGIPLVLHEQNAILGKVNRFLVKFSKCIFTAFPNVHPAARNFGNPIDLKISSIKEIDKRYDLRQDKALNLLIIGGSQGSKALNSIIPKSLALLKNNQFSKITHQTGFGNSINVQKQYENLGIKAECKDFIDDIFFEMKNADLLICRSGAMTVSEITAIGIAALLIPYPESADNHQVANAYFLSKSKAGWMHEQHQLTPEFLAQWLQKRSREELKQVALMARQKARENSAIYIAKTCEQILKN
ncbi:MAG: undecaprenyldiphospho-muramoylpentapeptide beta-N-acetylglucosaminyltransferase [Bordetella sp.]|nr:MAG: undecaprenyldiphospho-muramoylpentapeptide beta-N-acetylglucosaminyltransferase [Bordetella sp.]